MSTADGYVLPKPGVPKTLGVLNVIFGVLLVLVGFCQGAFVAGAGAILNVAEKVTKEAQTKVEANSKAQMKSYDDRIEAATTEEEKKAIEQEKARFSASQPKIVPMDFATIKESVDDPVVKSVNLGGIVTGLLLHIMLLIAGIGLIRLTSWGRAMSLWWAGLQIVQVLVLMVVTIIYALPAQQANNEKIFAKTDANIKAQGGAQAPGAAAQQMSKSMSLIAIPMVVAGSLTGIIYPIVLLIMLNTAGARAAILAKKQLDEFESTI
jgi:hypothetical protein